MVLRALYEFVTGRPPFRSPRVVETIRQVLQDSVIPPRKLRVETSPELERVILKALEKNKAQRYPTAQVLAEDLRQFHRTWLARQPRRRRRIFAHGSAGKEH